MRPERQTTEPGAAASKLRNARKTVLARITAPGPRKTSPSPLQPPWTPGPARYGVGVRHNVSVLISDDVILRADVPRSRWAPASRARRPLAVGVLRGELIDGHPID
jgi:hypothetical protein